MKTTPKSNVIYNQERYASVLRLFTIEATPELTYFGLGCEWY